MNAFNRTALKIYGKVQTDVAAEYADSHTLVSMLFNGAIDNLCKAKFNFDTGDIAARGEAITKAQQILFGLRSTLDHNEGGDLARLLDSLYDYCIRRLTQAHAQGESAPVQEVKGLIGQIREAWDTIPDQGDLSQVQP